MIGDRRSFALTQIVPAFVILSIARGQKSPNLSSYRARVFFFFFVLLFSWASPNEAWNKARVPSFVMGLKRLDVRCSVGAREPPQIWDWKKALSSVNQLEIVLSDSGRVRPWMHRLLAHSQIGQAQLRVARLSTRACQLSNEWSGWRLGLGELTTNFNVTIFLSLDAYHHLYHRHPDLSSLASLKEQASQHHGLIFAWRCFVRRSFVLFEFRLKIRLLSLKRKKDKQIRTYVCTRRPWVSSFKPLSALSESVLSFDHASSWSSFWGRMFVLSSCTSSRNFFFHLRMFREWEVTRHKSHGNVCCLTHSIETR